MSRCGSKNAEVSQPLIAVTAGEPAGIGPDLCLATASGHRTERLVIIADRDMLEQRARLLGLDVRLVTFDSRSVASRARGALSVLHVPVRAPVQPGRLDPANSAYVLSTIEAAVDGCLDGTFAAMATAPVHKGVINDAGIAFTGHTEFLAARTRAAHVVMMLVGGGMRVALATTHLPLREVAAAITRPHLRRTLEVLRSDLIRRFGIREPRILVAGLNPHAGESGYLGREEIDVIGPVIEELRAQGYRLEGPLPADTLFHPERLRAADAVLAMYHDQGLPVLKHASFGAGVNVTLGLPIVRTSVDHGTALEIAGTGRADAGSLGTAVKLAADLASARAAPRAPVQTS